MYRKNRQPSLHVMRWTSVILSFTLLAVCADVIALAQEIDLKPDATLSFTNDIVGLAEQELDATLPVDVSFSVGSVAVDLDADADVVSSEMRLDTLPALHAEVASLPASALKDALNQSLSQADVAINAIRSAGSGVSIDALYEQLKIIEKALDANFIDLVDESLDLAPMIKARLLLIAKPIEQRYDYLKYIATKVNSYTLDEVKDGLACLLRQTVVAIADGDGMAYRRDLLVIIAHVEEHRGTMIKEEEADRIRYKADLLLRNVAESGMNRACDVDLSTTIADIDIDGGLSWDEADYRAPSKDVCTHGLAVTAGYTGDEWSVSIDYEQEQRDYSDRLKDNDDRTKRSVDISVSRDVDLCSADLSALFDHEFYPNDIDEEIELDRVVQASAAIVGLLDRVLELHLVATLEGRLVKDLGEEGALGALGIGDRSEAVDCLDDFIGHLLDAEWGDDIEADTSQALITVARGILPRRTIQNIDIPLSLGFPFRGSDVTVDLEWESKTYPADSPLDHDTSTGKLSYTKDESVLILNGYLEREELVYPNAATKNRSLQEWEGSFDKQVACGDLALTLFQQLTTYPLASKKDQSVQKLDLDLDIDTPGLSISLTLFHQLTAYPLESNNDESVEKLDLDLDIDVADVSVALQWTDKATTHPNDATEPIVELTEMGLDGDWDVAQGTLSASLSDEQEWNTDHADTNSAEKVLVKETLQAELSWDGEIAEDLDLALSLTYKNVVDWADPSKDSNDITLQVELDLAI